MKEFRFKRILFTCFVFNSIACFSQTFSSPLRFGNQAGEGCSSELYRTAIQSTGKIIIAGTCNRYDGVMVGNILRLNNAGNLDGTFNPGGSGANGFVHALALQSDDKIIIGGQFVEYNGVSRKKIARLNTDGTLDATVSFRQRLADLTFLV